MARKTPEISGWGIILLFFGLFFFIIDGTTGKGLGYFLMFAGLIKMWWDLIKNV